MNKIKVDHSKNYKDILNIDIDSLVERTEKACELIFKDGLKSKVFEFVYNNFSRKELAFYTSEYMEYIVIKLLEERKKQDKLSESIKQLETLLNVIKKPNQ